ncbi:sigma-70 family RNA polymerase sigma factor [Modestobacter sp. VKM Ac-2986]|uniref:sigma-70 family RNA polymerase sigma factor n=1 Tax=Modestobacter sp. VKM Ac-2986 TaxID=3004140 RepID=UPI0022AB82CE|nr:sigma-70 family RNA polymerase sigma factor [Modestobacter sp. VKM Ac-2986]MCZ2830801.1 sigma-70 family RNA polymerase sigma factor [Modestobacter sp. VKM Ac-2986]
MTSLAGPDQGRTADGLLADLLDRWTGPALGLARRIVADDRIAEDVVQEAFLAYWRDPAAFADARGSFGSWFLSLVHHKAVDAVRHEASLRRRTDADAEDRARTEEPDLADRVVDRLGDARVRRALDDLPAAQREALVLAYWGGYTQREIAARTGAPLGTVKTRMLAGMRRLQQVLDGGVLTAV